MEAASKRPPVDDIQKVAPDLAPFYSTNGIEAIWDYLQGQVVHYRLGRVYPLDDQIYLAERMCEMLNWNYAHDGRWRVVWTEPAESKWHPYQRMFRAHVPQRMLFQWFDHRDALPGDERLIDYILDLEYPDMLDQIKDLKDLCVGAEGAWQHWHDTVWKETPRVDDAFIREVRATPIPMAHVLKEIE